jgi:esterase/lipase superfamily enzyme
MYGLIFLAVAKMLMISDRDAFWDTNDLSKQTQISIVDEKGNIDHQKQELSQLKQKNILLLIHGFNTDQEDVLQSYFLIQSEIEKKFNTGERKLYDQVVGYLWPGGGSGIAYYEAKGHAEAVSNRVANLMSNISDQATRVDVMAHSMGNFVFLEALKKIPEPKKSWMNIFRNLLGLPVLLPVGNFFSLGAAIDDESIEVDQIYGKAIERCQDVYIAYSEKDRVLKYLYTFAELDRALGSKGIEDISKLPSNVQLVDCSDVVDAHTKYDEVPQVFDFIRNRLLGVHPLPEAAQSVKLLVDNTVQVHAQ